MSRSGLPPGSVDRPFAIQPEAAFPGRWRLWIDTGGTFTDCLAVDPSGVVRRAKVLSSATIRTRIRTRPAAASLEVELPEGLPRGFFRGCRLRRLGGEAAAAGVADSGPGELELDRPAPREWSAGDRLELGFEEEAPVLAARLVTRSGPGEPLPEMSVRLATTRGTNALLERKGAAVTLFTTAGFADLVEIGTQQRPELFALEIVKPAPLHERVVEVDERVAADGRTLRVLDLEGLGKAVAELVESAPEARSGAAAVALMHAFKAPDNERRVGELLRARGFAHVSLSSELAPRIKLLDRLQTAVVDAYLAPIIGAYLDGVARDLDARSVHVMTSAGGLVGSSDYRAKDSLLSGPAAGVVGAARAARRSGRDKIIAFDMGGTSTDVSRFDGDFDYRFDTEVGGARLMSPALAIETVAAGGGSICRYADERLRVGPESAGALPGPACYGSGGPLCLTDVNLLLGRLAPERFGIPVDRGAAEAAAEELWSSVPKGARGGGGRERLLAGLLRIANERMAEAVRQISIRGGYRPSDYTLVAFGGAGAQHASALAGLLGMDEVLVPADASLLSAAGLGAARIERFAERQVLEELVRFEPRVAEGLAELAAEATAAVAGEGVPADEIEVRMRRVNLRLAGQDATLAVEWRPDASLAEAFRESYRDHYGYAPPPRAIEVDSLRVVASSRAPRATPPQESVPAGRAESPRPIWFDGGWLEAATRERAELGEGERLAGPALVFEAHTATVVEPGWTARLDAAGGLLLQMAERR